MKILDTPSVCMLFILLKVDYNCIDLYFFMYVISIFFLPFFLKHN